MKAPKEITDQWKLEYAHGDIEDIHNDSKISRVTISHALKTGFMSQKTFDAIARFYIKKREGTQKLIENTLK